MLFGISVLLGNSMDRFTGISVSVVQGFIRCGAVQGFSNGLAIAIIQSFLKTYLEIIEYLDNLFRKLRVFTIVFSTIAIAI